MLSTSSQNGRIDATLGRQWSISETTTPVTELEIRSWDDPMLDRLGYRPDSEYVEYFWLPVLGPSSIWILRRANHLLELSPRGAIVDPGTFGRSLGLGGTANGRSLLDKTIQRCIHFEVAKDEGGGRIAFRRRLPPLSPRQLERLPHELQTLHGTNPSTELDSHLTQARHRARQMALSLYRLGEDQEAIRSQLESWRFSEEIIREALLWLEHSHQNPLH